MTTRRRVSSRRREPWGPDIAGVLVCLVLAGTLGLSIVGFLVLCMVGGAVHGCLQGRPDRRRRLIAWIRTRFSIPATLIGAVVALLVGLPPAWMFTFALATGAAARCLQRRPELRTRITGAIGNCASSAARWLKRRARRRRRR